MEDLTEIIDTICRPIKIANSENPRLTRKEKKRFRKQQAQASEVKPPS